MLGQGEDAIVYGLVERSCIALLKVGTAAASDEDGVSGKGHGFVAQHIGHAGVGVADFCRGSLPNDAKNNVLFNCANLQLKSQ